MSKFKVKRWPEGVPPGFPRRIASAAAHGQALVEYALITVLVVLAIIVAITATGPAIGNIFSNTVFNLIGGSAPSATPLDPTEFWRLVTAVASYTPPAVIIPTNTPAAATATHTLAPSNTPNTPEPTDTPAPSDTPGPSPTPPDVLHNAPFYDSISTANWWRLDAGSIFAGTGDWTVQWYANRTLTAPVTCTTTVAYTQEINFRWGSGSGPAPGGACTNVSGQTYWRIDNFSTRWTRTVNFPTAQTLTLRTISDDGIRVRINGTEVPVVTDWSDHGERERTTTYAFAAETNYTLVVEYYEASGGATMVFQMRAASDDVGNCTWALSDENNPHSPSTAFSDSPGANYSNNTRCHIALRGAVRTSTLTQPPRMVFWDRWDLAATNDRAWLQIREYVPPPAVNTNAWRSRLIHSSALPQQLSWMREYVDLDNFYETDTSGVNTGAAINWAGMTIEFRFVLETDGSNTDNGWWIDDIAIENDVINRYYIGFTDNMETTPNNNWLPGGNWTLSGERTRNGSGAWTDSPGAWYTDGTNAVLELNGLVDLTTADSIEPVLVFYHAWDIEAGDEILVEYSLDRSQWYSLLPIDNDTATNNSLKEDSSNMAFARETISLRPRDGTTFWLRFRIVSDTGTGTNADGWWIDDISLQNRVSGYLPYPYTDPMDSSTMSNWLPDGQWSVASEQNPRSSPGVWTDSPGGNYTNATDTHLQTALPFLLEPVSSNRWPEFSFWHKRALAGYDNFSVEVSVDDGATWTEAWAYNYTDSTSTHPEAPGDQRQEFNVQMAWEYVSIDLRPYRHATETRALLIRFRLNALTNSSVQNGVWIDDVRLAEHQTETLLSVPFTDNMESGNVNWRAGGTWAIANDGTDGVHSGTNAWTDSVGGDYGANQFSVLELINPIDLRSVPTGSFPVLYWWDRFDVGNNGIARVQGSTSTWDGTSWGAWSAWTEIAQRSNTTTLSWDRREADLRAAVGQNMRLRLRFVVDSLQNSQTDNGYWIDDVSVQYYTPTVVSAATQGLYDGGESLLNWAADGFWGRGSLFWGSGSGSTSLGLGGWRTYFYDLREWGTCGGSNDRNRATNAFNGSQFSCSGVNRRFTPRPTATGVEIGDIDFSCGSSTSPDFTGACSSASWENDNDHLGIRFVRTVSVGPNDGQIPEGMYNFTLAADDAARLFISMDGGAAVEQIGATNPSCPSYWTSSHNANSPCSVLYEMVSGHTYTLDVWYYDDTGTSTIRLGIARQSFSFHDSPSGNYGDYDDASLTLNSVIVDMTGTAAPVLSWYHQYALNNGDIIRAEINAPYDASRFYTWRQIWSFTAGSSNGTRNTWTQVTVTDLNTQIRNLLGQSSYNPANVRIRLRFRLDTRAGTGTNNGWWIDEVLLAE